MLPSAAQAPAASVYATRAAAIRATLGAAAVREWDSLEDPTDVAQVAAYADQMARLSGAAQRSMANTLNAYLAIASGSRDEEWDEDEVTGDAVRGDDGGMSHAWSIPAFSMWKALGEGTPYAEALAGAREAVGVQAQTDLALAQREAMRAAGEAMPEVIGYRRVVGDSACPFCTLISTRLYYIEDLMPVHPNCQCSVAPVLRNPDGTIEDPGGILDGEEPIGSEAEFEEQAHEPEPRPEPEHRPRAETVPIEGFKVRSAENAAEMDELYGPGAADNLMGSLTEGQVEKMRETVGNSFEGIRPEVQDKLGAIRAADVGNRRTGDDGIGPNTLAWYLPEGGAWDAQYSNEIHIGEAVTGQRSIDESLRRNSVVGNWWVPVDTSNGLEEVLTHEIGHFLDFNMSPEDRKEMRNAAFRELETMMREKVAPRVAPGEIGHGGKEIDRYNAGRFLSVYGSTNSNEMIAEGWAEYKLSEKPGRMATVIGEHIMAALGTGGEEEEE